MNNTGKLTGKVTHIEPLGDGTNIEVEIGFGKYFRIKASEQINLTLGDSVDFDILLDKVLLFTPEGNLIKIGQSELAAI